MRNISWIKYEEAIVDKQKDFTNLGGSFLIRSKKRITDKNIKRFGLFENNMSESLLFECEVRIKITGKFYFAFII